MTFDKKTLKRRAYEKSYNKRRGRSFQNEKYNRWAAKNPDKIRAKSKRYRERHLERLRQKNRDWYKANKTLAYTFIRKRQALKKKATVNLRHITKWILEVKARELSTCYYCQKQVASADIHFDHIIALSKGGPHSIENLCVSCGPCNLSKGDKPIRMWITMGQTLLEL